MFPHVVMEKPQDHNKKRRIDGLLNIALLQLQSLLRMFSKTYCENMQNDYSPLWYKSLFPQVFQMVEPLQSIGYFPLKPGVRRSASFTVAPWYLGSETLSDFVTKSGGVDACARVLPSLSSGSPRNHVAVTSTAALSGRNYHQQASHSPALSQNITPKWMYGKQVFNGNAQPLSSCLSNSSESSSESYALPSPSFNNGKRKEPRETVRFADSVVSTAGVYAALPPTPALFDAREVSDSNGSAVSKAKKTIRNHRVCVQQSSGNSTSHRAVRALGSSSSTSISSSSSASSSSDESHTYTSTITPDERSFLLVSRGSQTDSNVTRFLPPVYIHATKLVLNEDGLPNNEILKYHEAKCVRARRISLMAQIYENYCKEDAHRSDGGVRTRATPPPGMRLEDGVTQSSLSITDQSAEMRCVRDRAAGLSSSAHSRVGVRSACPEVRENLQNPPVHISIVKALKHMLQHAVATTIQRYYRGYRVRKQYNNRLSLANKRNEAATKIQAVWRGKLYGRYPRQFECEVRWWLHLRQESAIVIQKNWRAYLDRRLVNFEQMTKTIMDVRVCASTVIQKFWRGHQTRTLIDDETYNWIIKWYWDAPGMIVEVIGSFSTPQWSKPHMMKYCAVRGCYILTLPRIPGTYELKFVVDGRYVCDGGEIVISDGAGHYNNIITVTEAAEPPLRKIRHSLRRFVKSHAQALSNASDDTVSSTLNGTPNQKCLEDLSSGSALVKGDDEQHDSHSARNYEDSAAENGVPALHSLPSLELTLDAPLVDLPESAAYELPASSYVCESKKKVSSAGQSAEPLAELPSKQLKVLEDTSEADKAAGAESGNSSSCSSGVHTRLGDMIVKMLEEASKNNGKKNVTNGGNSASLEAGKTEENEASNSFCVESSVDHSLSNEDGLCAASSRFSFTGNPEASIKTEGSSERKHFKQPRFDDWLASNSSSKKLRGFFTGKPVITCLEKLEDGEKRDGRAAEMPDNFPSSSCIEGLSSDSQSKAEGNCIKIEGISTDSVGVYTRNVAVIPARENHDADKLEADGGLCVSVKSSLNSDTLPASTTGDAGNPQEEGCSSPTSREEAACSELGAEETELGASEVSRRGNDDFEEARKPVKSGDERRHQKLSHYEHMDESSNSLISPISNASEALHSTHRVEKRTVTESSKTTEQKAASSVQLNITTMAAGIEEAKLFKSCEMDGLYEVTHKTSVSSSSSSSSSRAEISKGMAASLVVGAVCESEEESSPGLLSAGPQPSVFQKEEALYALATVHTPPKGELGTCVEATASSNSLDGVGVKAHTKFRGVRNASASVQNASLSVQTPSLVNANKRSSDSYHHLPPPKLIDRNPTAKILSNTLLEGETGNTIIETETDAASEHLTDNHLLAGTTVVVTESEITSDAVEGEIEQPGTHTIGTNPSSLEQESCVLAALPKRASRVNSLNEDGCQDNKGENLKPQSRLLEQAARCEDKASCVLALRPEDQSSLEVDFDGSCVRSGKEATLISSEALSSEECVFVGKQRSSLAPGTPGTSSWDEESSKDRYPSEASSSSSSSSSIDGKNGESLRYDTLSVSVSDASFPALLSDEESSPGLHTSHQDDVDTANDANSGSRSLLDRKQKRDKAVGASDVCGSSSENASKELCATSYPEVKPEKSVSLLEEEAISSRLLIEEKKDCFSLVCEQGVKTLVSNEQQEDMCVEDCLGSGVSSEASGRFFSESECAGEDEKLNEVSSTGETVSELVCSAEEGAWRRCSMVEKDDGVMPKQFKELFAAFDDDSHELRRDTTMVSTEDLSNHGEVSSAESEVVSVVLPGACEKVSIFLLEDDAKELHRPVEKSSPNVSTSCDKEDSLKKQLSIDGSHTVVASNDTKLLKELHIVENITVIPNPEDLPAVSECFKDSDATLDLSPLPLSAILGSGNEKTTNTLSSYLPHPPPWITGCGNEKIISTTTPQHNVPSCVLASSRDGHPPPPSHASREREDSLNIAETTKVLGDVTVCSSMVVMTHTTKSPEALPSLLQGGFTACCSHGAPHKPAVPCQGASGLANEEEEVRAPYPLGGKLGQLLGKGAREGKASGVAVCADSVEAGIDEKCTKNELSSQHATSRNEESVVCVEDDISEVLDKMSMGVSIVNPQKMAPTPMEFPPPPCVEDADYLFEGMQRTWLKHMEVPDLFCQPAEEGVVCASGVGEEGVVCASGVGEEGVVCASGVGEEGVVCESGVGEEGVVCASGVGEEGVVCASGVGEEGVVCASGVGEEGVVCASGVGEEGVACESPAPCKAIEEATVCESQTPLPQAQETSSHTQSKELHTAPESQQEEPSISHFLTEDSASEDASTHTAVCSPSNDEPSKEIQSSSTETLSSLMQSGSTSIGRNALQRLISRFANRQAKSQKLSQQSTVQYRPRAVEDRETRLRKDAELRRIYGLGERMPTILEEDEDEYLARKQSETKNGEVHTRSSDLSQFAEILADEDDVEEAGDLENFSRGSSEDDPLRDVREVDQEVEAENDDAACVMQSDFSVKTSSLVAEGADAVCPMPSSPSMNMMTSPLNEDADASFSSAYSEDDIEDAFSPPDCPDLVFEESDEMALFEAGGADEDRMLKSPVDYYCYSAGVEDFWGFEVICIVELEQFIDEDEVDIINLLYHEHFGFEEDHYRWGNALNLEEEKDIKESSILSPVCVSGSSEMKSGTCQGEFIRSLDEDLMISDEAEDSSEISKEREGGVDEALFSEDDRMPETSFEGEDGVMCVNSVHGMSDVQVERAVAPQISCYHDEDELDTAVCKLEEVKTEFSSHESQNEGETAIKTASASIAHAADAALCVQSEEEKILEDSGDEEKEEGVMITSPEYEEEAISHCLRGEDITLKDDVFVDESPSLSPPSAEREAIAATLRSPDEDELLYAGNRQNNGDSSRYGKDSGKNGDEEDRNGWVAAASASPMMVGAEHNDDWVFSDDYDDFYTPVGDSSFIQEKVGSYAFDVSSYDDLPFAVGRVFLPKDNMSKHGASHSKNPANSSSPSENLPHGIFTLEDDASIEVSFYTPRFGGDYDEENAAEILDTPSSGAFTKRALCSWMRTIAPNDEESEHAQYEVEQAREERIAHDSVEEGVISSKDALFSLLPEQVSPSPDSHLQHDATSSRMQIFNHHDDIGVPPSSSPEVEEADCMKGPPLMRKPPAFPAYGGIPAKRSLSEDLSSSLSEEPGFSRTDEEERKLPIFVAESSFSGFPMAASSSDLCNRILGKNLKRRSNSFDCTTTGGDSSITPFTLSNVSTPMRMFSLVETNFESVGVVGGEIAHFEADCCFSDDEDEGKSDDFEGGGGGIGGGFGGADGGSDSNNPLISSTHSGSEMPISNPLISSTHSGSEMPTGNPLISSTHSGSEMPISNPLISSTHSGSEMPTGNPLISSTQKDSCNPASPGAKTRVESADGGAAVLLFGGSFNEGKSRLPELSDTHQGGVRKGYFEALGVVSGCSVTFSHRRSAADERIEDASRSLDFDEFGVKNVSAKMC